MSTVLYERAIASDWSGALSWAKDWTEAWVGWVKNWECLVSPSDADRIYPNLQLPWESKCTFQRREGSLELLYSRIGLTRHGRWARSWYLRSADAANKNATRTGGIFVVCALRLDDRYD
jgi:hypothetical protein